MYGEDPVNTPCTDEIKLDSSYPDSQSHIDGYKFPHFCSDRNKHGGSKILYI